jgi:hypothetical protein
MATGVFVLVRWRVLGCRASKIGKDSEIAVLRVNRGINEEFSDARVAYMR